MIQHVRILLVTAIILLLGSGSQVAADTPKAANAPTEICPILIGSQLPVITLQDIDGKSFDLNKAITQKPTILIYFRGGW